MRRTRWALLGLQKSLTTPVGAYVTERSISVRTIFLARTGSRKKTLTLGALLPKALAGRAVILYRNPQPNPTQFYPVFTPWKRRVKALGVQVAPVIPVGTTGTGISVQHYLGLSLLQFGGMKF